jgi:anti-sigma-K factor RskA
MTAEIHTLVGAYVLDAVDDLERAQFDRHLRECEACRAEVDELRQASARLADGTWSVPPPRLRENVLAAIATTPQVSPVVPPASRRPVSRRRFLTAAAAVVVAAGGAATVAYGVQEQRVREAQATEARIRSILAADDLELREQPVTGGGRVTVALSRQQDAGVIMMAAAAPPTGDRAYQLWTVRSKVAVSEGVLDVGQSAAVQVVEGVTAASAVGVTVEPAGGSATPTQPMVAAVKLI